MFSWPCINQCSETNVMHLSNNLLWIKDLYMFRALLAHPQDVTQKAVGILRVHNVSWLCHGWLQFHRNRSTAS
jgi:hypothetical protein